jgi:LPS sulfotransferase NodH
MLARSAGLRERDVKARVKKLTKDLLRASTGRLGAALCSPSTKLVIFSRGRTGSNLLVSLLRSHPQIWHHHEIFGEYYLQHGFIRDEINRMGAVAYFERVTRRMFTERVVGVKFLYFQLEPEYAHHWNVPDIPSLLPVLKERRDLRIIHLKRRNRLATLVSWKLARHTRRWARLGPGQLSRSDQSRDSMYDDVMITLSPDECRNEFAQIEQWERYYDAAFANHPYVEMYYEDLVTDRRGEMTRALELLGLEDCELQSPLRRQNTRTLEDVVENFEELRRCFENTDYAYFFTKTAP